MLLVARLFRTVKAIPHADVQLTWWRLLARNLVKLQATEPPHRDP